MFTGAFDDSCHDDETSVSYNLSGRGGLQVIYNIKTIPFYRYKR